MNSSGIIESTTNWCNKAGFTFYIRRIDPLTNPRSIVLYLHGLNNFVDEICVTRFGNEVARKGFIFVAYDQRGFGRSSSSSSLGLINSYTTLIDDCQEFIEDFVRKIFTENKDKQNFKLFICGFSMGAALSMLLSLRIANSSDDIWKQLHGLILLAPAITIPQPPTYIKGFLSVISIVGAGWLDWGPAGTDMGFRERTDGIPWNQWPLREGTAESIQELASSPLSRFPGTLHLGTAREVISLADISTEKMSDISIPFICCHGTGDGIVPYWSSQNFVEKATSRDKIFKLYNGICHAMLSDSDFKYVIGDILSWINERL